MGLFSWTPQRFDDVMVQTSRGWIPGWIQDISRGRYIVAITSGTITVSRDRLRRA